MAWIIAGFAIGTIWLILLTCGSCSIEVEARNENLYLQRRIEKLEAWRERVSAEDDDDE